jgi:hypothetical protein
MSRLRSEYEAHQSIVRALDAKRIQARPAPTMRRVLSIYATGAATGAALALVWIGAYLVRGIV